jgi:hypothetical protein
LLAALNDAPGDIPRAGRQTVVNLRRMLEMSLDMSAFLWRKEETRAGIGMPIAIT